MKSLNGAALLWAYDTSGQWGLTWRPRTLLRILGLFSVLGVVPAFAIGMIAGQFVSSIDLVFPVVLIAAAWNVWGIVRIVVGRNREELSSPPLAHFFTAIDLRFISWFTVRFVLLMILEALYVALVLGGFLHGYKADLGTGLLAYLVLFLGYVTRLAVSAQLAEHLGGLLHAATLLLGVLPFAVVLFLTGNGLWTTLSGLAILSVAAVAHAIGLLRRDQGRFAFTSRRPHRVPVLNGPQWWGTVLALRTGVWVPPVRALTVRVMTLCILLASTIFLGRMASVSVDTVFEMAKPALQQWLTYGAFLLGYMLSDFGVCWYGVRSRCRELRVAWEAGATGTGLVIGSVVAHLADGVLVLTGISFMALGLGLAITAQLVLATFSAVLASACGYALFAASKFPDGRARLSLAGTLAGVIMGVPALIGVRNSSLLWLAAVFLVLLIGGLAWATRKVIADASFSIM